MPQIKVRGIDAERIRPISMEMVDNLTGIIGCPRQYFTIECFQSISVQDGAVCPVYPFIEVAWFDRGQEVQDRVAKEITRLIHSIGVKDVDIAFTHFEKHRYYENGEHF